MPTDSKEQGTRSKSQGAEDVPSTKESLFDETDGTGFSGIVSTPKVSKPVREGTVADAFANGHMTHLTTEERLKSGWYDGTDIARTVRSVTVVAMLVAAGLAGILGWNATNGNAEAVTPLMVIGVIIALGIAVGAVMAGNRMRRNSRKKTSEEIDIDATGEWLMYAYHEEDDPVEGGHVLVAHLSECSWCPMVSDKTVILVGPMGIAAVKKPSDAYNLNVRDMTVERGGAALYDYFTKGLAETLNGTQAKRDDEKPPAEYARLMATKKSHINQ